MLWRRCIACRIYDQDVGCWIYRRAPITDWTPGPGLDSRLRQFRCGNCEAEFYAQIPASAGIREPEAARVR